MIKVRTPQQEQWRLGYIAGLKKSMEKMSELEDEIYKLKLDSLLLKIMQAIGVEEKESGQYWPGMEQAVAIYDDMLSEPEKYNGCFGMNPMPGKPSREFWESHYSDE